MTALPCNSVHAMSDNQVKPKSNPSNGVAVCETSASDMFQTENQTNSVSVSDILKPEHASNNFATEEHTMSVSGLGSSDELNAGDMEQNEQSDTEEHSSSQNLNVIKKPLTKIPSPINQSKKGKSPNSKKRKQDKRASTGDESERDDDSSHLSQMIMKAVKKGVDDSLGVLEEKSFQILDSLKKTVDELKKGVEYRDHEIADLQVAHECLGSKFKEVEGRLLRCEKLVEDLREETISLKSCSMRDNVVFYNIVERNDNISEDCFALLHGFINSEMKVPNTMMSQLQFDRIHHMGTRQPGKNRPIIAKCASTRTKELIFKHTKNLRGTGFGVSEQQPPEINERRAFLMPKFREAKSARMPTKWSMDKLIVNGLAHTKPKDHIDFSTAVPTPIPADIIKHTLIHAEKGSSFQAHVVPIDDKSQVIPTLHQLYTNHNVAKATHNIYAYRFQGQGKVVENSCDDGEFGAGNRVLNVLRNMKVNNAMVIVTRWYGGVHMGPHRFRCITKAAEDAIKLLDS